MYFSPLKDSSFKLKLLHLRDFLPFFSQWSSIPAPSPPTPCNLNQNTKVIWGFSQNTKVWGLFVSFKTIPLISGLVCCFGFFLMWNILTIMLCDVTIQKVSVEAANPCRRARDQWWWVGRSKSNEEQRQLFCQLQHYRKHAVDFCKGSSLSTKMSHGVTRSYLFWQTCLKWDNPIWYTQAFIESLL